MRLKNALFLSLCIHLMVLFIVSAVGPFVLKNESSDNHLNFVSFQVELQEGMAVGPKGNETYDSKNKFPGFAHQLQKQDTTSATSSESNSPEFDGLAPSLPITASATENSPESLSSSTLNSPADSIVSLSSNNLHPYFLSLRRKIFFKLNSIIDLNLNKGALVSILINTSGLISNVKI